jgi:hypothetical protein
MMRMYNQYNKNKIKDLIIWPKGKQFYVPVFLFLASIVVYALVHLGYQLESYRYAFPQLPALDDFRVLGGGAVVMMIGMIVFFFYLLSKK